MHTGIAIRDVRFETIQDRLLAGFALSDPNDWMADLPLLVLWEEIVHIAVVDATGRIRIQFKHLPVYHTRAAEEYEIWSHRAVLEASSVERVVVEGAANIHDSIDDATVTIGDSEMTDWKALLVARPVTRIKLSFGSGEPSRSTARRQNSRWSRRSGISRIGRGRCTRRRRHDSAGAAMQQP
jgi:hypothetical protein